MNGKGSLDSDHEFGMSRWIGERSARGMDDGSVCQFVGEVIKRSLNCSLKAHRKMEDRETNSIEFFNALHPHPSPPSEDDAGADLLTLLTRVILRFRLHALSAH